MKNRTKKKPKSKQWNWREWRSALRIQTLTKPDMQGRFCLEIDTIYSDY